MNPKATDHTWKGPDSMLSVVVAVLALVCSLKFDNMISLLSST